MTDCIRLVAIDLDGTLIPQCSWQVLNLAMGVTSEEDEHFFRIYHEGKISYREWIDVIIGLYRQRGNLSRGFISDALRQCRPRPGAREAIADLKACGFELALISGTMDVMVKAMAEELGIGLFAYNSEFVFDGQDRLAEVRLAGEDDDVKLANLHGMCQRLGIRLDECVCVGDGRNDRLLFQATGRGVTFEHCTKLHDCCWKIIKDWTELVPLLCNE